MLRSDRTRHRPRGQHQLVVILCRPTNLPETNFVHPQRTRSDGRITNFVGWLMDAPIVSALAALAGAAIGGLTSVLASWLTQHTQARAQWIAQDNSRRQELYREFIDDAAKAYVHALQSEEADMPLLVSLYAKIGRMRVLSSQKVVESAEQIAQTIVNTYLAPDRSFFELSEMVNHDAIDILQNFSEACRAEFQISRTRLFRSSGA